MKKKLYVQKVTPRKPSKKSGKKRKNLRSKIFKILFQGIEAIWMLVQIIEYLSQIFK